MNSPSDEEVSDLRRGLEWQTACTKALLESQTRLAVELAECKAKLARVEALAEVLEKRVDVADVQTADSEEDAFQTWCDAETYVADELRAALRGEP